MGGRRTAPDGDAQAAAEPLYRAGTAFAAAVESVRAEEQDTGTAAAGLVAGLDDEELLGLLDGDASLLGALKAAGKIVGARGGVRVPAFRAGEVARLGIPGIRFTDGPRGVTIAPSTSFPVPIARAATFDPALERAVGDAMGREARAVGANLMGVPCINLAPFPGWGRAQESYGEDPLLLGAMGAALCEGLAPWAMSTVKHLALNSMDEARFTVDVHVAEDVLHEVYLPHFRTVVEAGVDSVMSAYNRVGGQWAGQSHRLLTRILREEWGFTGFVQTDWVWGLRDPVGSVAAGQDLEMPARQQRARALPAALADGRLARADAVRAATRLVAAQLGLAVRARPTPTGDVLAGPEHRALARDVARRGTVLLRNEPVDGTPVLPLAASGITRLAVVGRLADRPNLGDTGSSNVKPPDAVTVLDGLRERFGDRVVTPAPAGGPAAAVEAAVEAARYADAVVVVVGLTPADEGEALVALDRDALAVFGPLFRFRPVAALVTRLLDARNRRAPFGGDRRDLRLSAEDVALVRAVAAAGDRTVVVVVGGGTVVTHPWDADVPAVLLAWYPGMEGGRAVADILLGDAEPAGRLPVAIPRDPGDLPEVDWRARTVRYDRWWGQRRLDRDGVAAAYPFGYGLGYTTFRAERLVLGPLTGESFRATVTVTNTGTRSGRHVVQVYARRPDDPDRRVRALVGFTGVRVPAGDTVDVTVECSVRPLQRWTPAGFVLDPGPFRVEAAAHAADPDAVTADLDVGTAAADGGDG